MFPRDSIRTIINIQKCGIFKILIVMHFLITPYFHNCGQKAMINSL